MALIFHPGTGEMDDEALKQLLAESRERAEARIKARARAKKQLISLATVEDAETLHNGNARSLRRSPSAPISGGTSGESCGFHIDWHAVVRSAARYMRRASFRAVLVELPHGSSL
ncbi:hypothetical protein SEPCBS119000_005278 [Sporothrix epigloea]|uniref:Uncharacterized protein n=1 Tax=Sporothrix epigloea TaxID=1892477 RepID=A0ABP0E0K7_9PEZI